MSLLDFTRESLGRAMLSFHPSSMPPLSRAHYKRELIAWSLLPIALGAVEGGLVGIVAKNAFADAVPPRILNTTVAVLAGAPAFANILSFIWAGLSHGRHKVRFVAGLQLLALVLIGLVATAPMNLAGLAVLVVGAVGARICWSGVVTLRSTIWRANYPRHARATLAGKLATVQSLAMAGSTFAIGAMMNIDAQAFRIAYPAVAVIGLVGVFVYNGLRMRGHKALLAAEAESDPSLLHRFHPMQGRQLLLSDARFRAYMTCMFIFGMGNLMVIAPLVIMLKDVFALRETAQVAIATTIPLLLLPVCVPLWGRLLDRWHIVRFRAVHCWAFVASIAMFLTAAITLNVWLLYLAAVFKGVAIGGGVLGWNLGHHDFAPEERTSEYMGVHVMLTGLRGVLAPLIGVSVYEMLEFWRVGAGPLVLVLCLLLTTTGGIGFAVLARSMRDPGP